MDGLEDFHIFGAEVEAPQHDEVQEVPVQGGNAGGNAGANAGGNAAGARLNWTPLMSAHVLEKFSDLVATGLRTDKGFKEVHLNAVAKDLSSFINQPVTSTQIYNHLRKWRTKWVKICNLKDLSGANWDEEQCMITMDSTHYNGHVFTHPKDAEFLNKPLVNYNFMQNVFGGGVATGRYAMGSNEPLGTPNAGETIDLDEETDDAKKGSKEAGPSKKVKADKGKAILEDDLKEKKRKRALNEEDAALLSGMTEAVMSVGIALKESNHNEAAPGIYEAVMGVPGFARSDLMMCLNYLMDKKGTALVFIGMKPEDKALWLAHHLAEARARMAFQ